GGSSRKVEASALSRRPPVARAVSTSPLRGQADGEPDRSRWRSRGLFQLAKAAGPVKPHGAVVAAADRQVCTARTHVPYRSEPALHQPPPDAGAAHVPHQVDVQMRGVRHGDRARRAARMMDAVAHVLVVSPFGVRRAGRIAIELSETWPPFG